MHFDDGSNPWVQSENYIKVFNFGFYRSDSPKCYISQITLGVLFLMSMLSSNYF